MNYKKACIRIKGVLAILLILNVLCHSQELYYEQFTEADGLPSMMTYEMVQDSSGILWVGTENGLVSYDGEEFVKHTHPKLIDLDIIEISLDKNGRVYFLNLSHQLGYIEDDIVHLINTDSIGGKITNIVTTEKNSYLHSKNGIFEFSQNDENQFLFKRTDVNSFFIKNHQYTEGYRTKISSKIWQIKSKLYNFELDLSQNKSYGKTADNRCFHFGNFREFQEAGPAISHLIEQDRLLRFVNAYDKSFLIYSNGVELYDSKTKQFHSLLKSKLINTVFVDNEKNIWFSTQNEGIIKIPHIDYQLTSKTYAVHNDYGINDFVQDENGTVYFGTTTGHVLIYSKEGKLIKKFIASPRRKAVSFQKHGAYIYGGSDQTLFRINQKTLNHKLSKNENRGFKSFLFKNDSVYLGMRTGIIKSKFEDFDINKFTHKSIDFLSGYWINDMYIDDSTQSLYAATSTGLFNIGPSGIPVPIYIDGVKEYNVSSIVGSGQNSIWVGTRNAGAIKLRDGTVVERYTTSNGLISNNVNSITISENKLIVSTVDGVGIKDIEGNEKSTINELGGVIPKEVFYCELIDNDYWLATNSGLSIVKKDQLKYFKKKGPILSINNIYANGDKIKLENEIKLSHEISNIQINFKNVSLQNGKNKSIKYRISDTDTTWLFSKDPLIRLQSLKHGTYNIEAIGINSLKEEGNKVSLKFIIYPPWWQTAWARILGLILAFVVVQFILGIRTKRIRKEESTKRDYLTQINNIKDQALQLQMNPHFIFNSLNAIQNFIGTDEEVMAMNYLARFARLIRLIFEHSKGTTITLEDEIEFITLYLDLEKLRFKDKIDIHFNIDPKVKNAKDIIRLPPLLIQPIIENSFKHGLFHKKTKGTLYIDYTIENEMLKVIIQDDGVGREKSKQIALKNTEKQSSSGIKTTFERIELLNFSKVEKKNKMNIEDLYDEDGNAVGTKTTLKLVI